MWRFTVLGDPTVDIFVSRDVDSLVNEREVEVVNEWLESPFAFHSARDMDEWPNNIWAGFWGAKNHALDETESKNLRDAFVQVL